MFRILLFVVCFLAYSKVTYSLYAHSAAKELEYCCLGSISSTVFTVAYQGADI